MRGFALTASLLLAGCATTPAPVTPTEVAPLPAADVVPPNFQYLYGSGEGSAIALTAFHALIAYATDKAADRPDDSVVLAADSPLVGASFVPCGDKPLAAVFDVDETLIWNLGVEQKLASGVPYTKSLWRQWEADPKGAIVAVPGAVHAVDDLRKLGITPIFNSNRDAEYSEQTAKALAAAGLGTVKHGETLFLKGDDDQGDAKDGRRATIAARWCVIAMAGDQLGDFSDRFGTLTPAERRQIAQHSAAAGKWGKGWFMLPNPVYGSALKGTMNEVFPADKRWEPEETK
jgi:5'-nucleotidase (lipoprotein e(P4) family)